MGNPAFFVGVMLSVFLCTEIHASMRVFDPSQMTPRNFHRSGGNSYADNSLVWISGDVYLRVGYDKPKLYNYSVSPPTIEDPPFLVGENTFLHKADVDNSTIFAVKDSEKGSIPIFIDPDLQSYQKVKFTGEAFDQFLDNLSDEELKLHSSQVIGFIDGKIIGFIGSLKEGPLQIYIQAEHLPENKTHIVLRLVDEISPPTEYSRYPTVLPLPGEHDEYGLLWNEKLYRYNTSSNQFYESGKFSFYNNKTGLGYGYNDETFYKIGGRVFHLLDRFLNEIMWTMDNDMPALKLIRHLPHMFGFMNIILVKDMNSMIITTIDYNSGGNALFGSIIYNPFEQRYCIFQEDFMKAWQPIILWSSKLQELGIYYQNRTDFFNPTTIFATLSRSQLEEMPFQNANDYDKLWLEQDSTFHPYIPTAEDLKGLAELPIIKEMYVLDNCIPMVYNLVQPLNLYRLIAAWNFTNNPVLNNLIYPGRFTELQSFSDLSNYLGAPVFYHEKANPLLVRFGIIAGFSYKRKSSNAAYIISPQHSQAKAPKSLIWIGIVAYFPYAATQTEKKNEYPESIPDTFEVVSGALQISHYYERRHKRGSNQPKPILSSVRNGIWKFKTMLIGNTTAQLLAFHEDFEHDLVASDWSVPPEYEPIDIPKPCPTDGNSRTIATFTAWPPKDSRYFKIEELEKSYNWTHGTEVASPSQRSRFGIFDASHFGDTTVVDKEPKVGWEEHFRFDHQDSWQKYMKEIPLHNGARAVPYGVIAGEEIKKPITCLIKKVEKETEKEEKEIEKEKEKEKVIEEGTKGGEEDEVEREENEEIVAVKLVFLPSTFAVEATFDPVSL